MITNTCSKETAAYILGDKISEMRMDLERAELIMQEVTEEFFAKCNPQDKDDRYRICYEFNRYGVYTDIVSDYLFKIRKELDTLYETQKAYSPVVE